MDQLEVVARLKEATVEMYQLGLTFPDPMIPADPANCRTVPAGPVTFVVESRHLTDAAVDAALGRDSGTNQLFDDFGGTVHVHGTIDGLEHLRFDCFDAKPHYHYVNHAGGTSTVCRIDEHAEGDPIRWTIGRLNERLPEMLAYAGASDLADQVRRHRPAIATAIAEVERLIQQAHAEATAQWGTAVTSDSGQSR